LGPVLAGQHHALLLKLERRRLGHDGELAIAAEEGKIAALKLADRAGGDEVEESPLLQLAEAARRAQTPRSDAKRRDIRGFVGWSTHCPLLGTPKRPVSTAFCRKSRLEGQFTPLLPGWKVLTTYRSQMRSEFMRKKIRLS